MTIEQLTDKVIDNGKTVSALQESLKSAHKRIDDNDRITQGIHELALNLKSLTIQLKNLAEGVEKSLQAIDARVMSQETKLRALEGRSGKKWDTVVEKIIIVIAGAIAAFAMSQIGF